MYKPRFKGTHYDAGLHYGTMLRSKGVDLSPLLNFSQERRILAKATLPMYQEHYPEILEEIRGMAKGLDLSYVDFSTFILTIGALDHSIGCTCFCYRAEKEYYLVRNHDMFTSLKKVTEAALYRLGDGHYFIGHGDGLIGKEDGLNEYGLGVGINFIAPKVIKPGLNFFLMVRLLLEKCKTTEEALILLEKLPTMTSQNIMLVDRSGDMAVVEMCPDLLRVRRPKDGQAFMISTNHFLHPDMLAYDHRPMDNWYHTMDRYQTIEEKLSDHQELTQEIGLDLAKGKYGFTCQYGAKLGFDTLWSVSYGLKNLSVLRAEGNPKRATFKKDERLTWALGKK